MLRAVVLAELIHFIQRGLFSRAAHPQTIKGRLWGCEEGSEIGQAKKKSNAFPAGYM